MLYKKYHRSYVKQFKIGTEFINRTYHTINVVTEKPYKYLNQICIGVCEGKQGLIYYCDGKIPSDIVITRHVI